MIRRGGDILVEPKELFERASYENIAVEKQESSGNGFAQAGLDMPVASGCIAWRSLDAKPCVCFVDERVTHALQGGQAFPVACDQDGQPWIAVSQ